jgi:hypothetical protein
VLQLAIMGGTLKCVRRADRRVNVGGVLGRGHGHACATAQLAGTSDRTCSTGFHK